MLLQDAFYNLHLPSKQNKKGLKFIMLQKVLRNIPNILTIFRIALIPFIIITIINDEYFTAIMFFILSGLTDVLDGFIARKFNFITDFGKLMDPLADKLTQIATLISIVINGLIPYWILIIIVLKEVILVCGAAFLYGKSIVTPSKWFGKLSTVVLYIAIFLSMTIKAFNLPPIYETIDFYIYCAAIVTTLFSLVMYFKPFCNKDLLKKENVNRDGSI